MTTVRENLIAARALIADPAVYQERDKVTGSALYWATQEAVGADLGLINDLFDAIEPFWSGVRNHDDVMALFDRAIAAQGGE